MSRFGQAGGRGSRSASLCPLLACLVAPALAGASDSAHKLIDGSKPPSIPKVLRESGGRLTMTRVRAETVTSISGVLTHCPESDQALHPGRVIERVGVTGRSVTFLVDHTTIAGCDRSPRARSIFGRWCGASGWHFARGRLSDPRLDVCYDRRSRPVIAFGWINAVRRAKWIVVDQPG
jgi:hypothetical protein